MVRPGQDETPKDRSKATLTGLLFTAACVVLHSALCTATYFTGMHAYRVSQDCDSLKYYASRFGEEGMDEEARRRFKARAEAGGWNHLLASYKNTYEPEEQLSPLDRDIRQSQFNRDLWLVEVKNDVVGWGMLAFLLGLFSGIGLPWNAIWFLIDFYRYCHGK